MVGKSRDYRPNYQLPDDCDQSRKSCSRSGDPLCRHHRIQSGGYALKIDRYTVVKKIGRGGMVFLVYDKAAGRHVALKQLRSDLKHTKKKRAQFYNEALLTSKLNHPNIIPIYAIVNNEKGPKAWHCEWVGASKREELQHRVRSRSRPAGVSCISQIGSCNCRRSPRQLAGL